MATQTSPRKPRPLSQKQQAFILELPTAKSLTDAALAAGYDTPRKNAHIIAYENLRNPTIAAAIQSQADTIAEKAGVSQLWVLEHLKTNSERAMQAEPVYDKKGEPTGDYTYQGAVANQAYQLIGKFLRMFDEQVPSQSPPTSNTFILALMNDESTRALADALAKRMEGIAGGDGRSVE